MASSSTTLVLAVGAMLAKCIAGQVLPLNAGCGLGTGYQLSPAGLPFAQAGLPFAQAGLPIAQAGLPFTQAGLPFAQAGLPIAQASLPLTSSSFPGGFSFANLPKSGTCGSPLAPGIPNIVSFSGNLPITGFTIATGLPFAGGLPLGSGFTGGLPVGNLPLASPCGNLPVVEPVIANGMCSSLSVPSLQSIVY